MRSLHSYTIVLQPDDKVLLWLMCQRSQNSRF